MRRRISAAFAVLYVAGSHVLRVVGAAPALRVIFTLAAARFGILSTRAGVVRAAIISGK